MTTLSPSSFDAKTRPTSRWPGTDSVSVSSRFSGRTGGPAVRRPSLSYWPPWHGHANEVPFSSTGQPRCMQVFETTVNELSASLRTNATRRSM
jgi:hypothetical protein